MILGTFGFINELADKDKAIEILSKGLEVMTSQRDYYKNLVESEKVIKPKVTTEKELLWAAQELGANRSRIVDAKNWEKAFPYGNMDRHIDKLREDAYKILRKYPSLKFLALDEDEPIPGVEFFN